MKRLVLRGVAMAMSVVLALVPPHAVYYGHEIRDPALGVATLRIR